MARTMKRLLECIVGIALLYGSAHAQSTKSALQTLTTNSFPTQSNGGISPAIMASWAATVINSFQQYTAVRAVTSTTDTMLVSDYGQLVTYNNASPVALTLPQALAVNSFYPWNDYACNIGAGLVTITPTASTINGATTLALAKGQCAQIVSDGANYQTILSGQNAINLVIGTTTVSGGTTGDVLYNNGGLLGNETAASLLTAGTGINITGTSPATITNAGVTQLNTLTGALTLTPTDGGKITNSGSSLLASSPAGFINVLRNSSLTAWFHGCVSGACTATTTAATSNWCAEGVFVLPTGASVTCQATATVPAGNPGYYALKITGLTSNTDIKVRFPVESYTAAKIAGLATTFQFTFINNSGSSITPALSTKYPTTQDGGVTGGAAWGASTADLGSTNLTACPNGSTCTEAYTLTVNASANLGYEFVVDFGAMASNADSITIGAGFDARATPGISTGINANPPLPEVHTPAEDIVWCERFFQDSYDNMVAPGASSHLGMAGGAYSITSSSQMNLGVTFHVPMRAVPTMAYWDGAGTASKLSTIPAASVTFTDGVTAGEAPFNVSTKGFIFEGNNATTNTAFIHYTADASLWGG